MAKSDMCANVNDWDIARLQRIFGPGTTPRPKARTVLQYDQDRRIAATYGCPCDACRFKATCIAPCDLYRTWISRGATQPHKRRKLRLDATP